MLRRGHDLPEALRGLQGCAHGKRRLTRGHSAQTVSRWTSGQTVEGRNVTPTRSKTLRGRTARVSTSGWNFPIPDDQLKEAFYHPGRTVRKCATCWNGAASSAVPPCAALSSQCPYSAFPPDLLAGVPSRHGRKIRRLDHHGLRTPAASLMSFPNRGHGKSYRSSR